MPRLIGPALAVLALSVPLAAAVADQPDWQIGAKRLSVSGTGAPSLHERAMGEAGLLDPEFLLETGGVDLEAVARPALGATPVRVAYDRAAVDGHRLTLSIGGIESHPAVADWELKPIADLADSPYTAEVTLFGEGAARTGEIMPRFHPALKDTLLGMRLLQADLMLIHPEIYRETPRLGGTPVLGAGEALPPEAPSRDAAQKLAALLDDYEYQSWLLTDIGESATLEARAGETGIGLHPFYYFWSSRAGRLALRLVRLDRLEAVAPAEERTRLQDRVDEAARLFDAADHEGSEARTPAPVSALSDKLRARETLIAALNPLAWNAVVTTSRLAALFRFVKTEDPAGWHAFHASLADIAVLPAVRTPTHWARD